VTEYGDVPPVQGNDARLGQVFLNLIVNAAQAIREGAAAQNEIRISTRRAGDAQVLTEIRDTGAGIAPKTLERLFEPFFTTKPVGIGTGLGLSICRRIVHEHGGSITAESTLGRGTIFRVLLPLCTVQHAAPVVKRTPLRPARRGRILLIDDEPKIAQIVRRGLDGWHDVTAVTSGSCDMMMPQMTGVDFYRAAATVTPDLAEGIIFMTGGTFSAEARDFLARLPNSQVEKPFELVHLRRMIDERIAAPARRLV
jgi:CheY-like chemotaxis protein